MAEKLGEGRRTEDRRGTGRARRVRHTVGRDANNMVGDKRKLSHSLTSNAEGTRAAPVAIAKTLGDVKKPSENGGGSRAVPKAMKVGEW